MSKSTLFDPTQIGVLHLAEATQFSDTGIVSRALHDQGGVRMTRPSCGSQPVTGAAPERSAPPSAWKTSGAVAVPSWAGVTVSL